MIANSTDVYRICPNGHRNPLAQAVCTECSADLDGIEPTFGSSEPPSAREAGDSDRNDAERNSETYPCDCVYPLVGDGGKLCGACGGVVQVVAMDAAAPESGPERDPAFNVYLELPGGSRILLGSEGVLIGRDPTAVETPVAAALKPYRGVSGRHLCLAVERDSVTLVDLGSRNGTWIRTEKLRSYSPYRIPVPEDPYPIWLGEKAKLHLIREKCQ